MFEYRNQPVAEPLLVGCREAARLLGVCEKTIFNLTQSGQLQPVRIGRAVRYHVRDLEAFIEAKKNSEKPLDIMSGTK